MTDGLFFVRPNDVVIFRQSTHFDAGEGATASGTFPPTGIPFMGAFRARIIADRGLSFRDFAVDRDIPRRIEGLRKLIGGVDDYGQLQLNGPWIASKSDGVITCYFPTPMDAPNLKTKRFSDNGCLSWPTDENGNEIKLNLLLADHSDVERDERWLPSLAMHNYLCGNGYETDLEAPWGQEDSVGIEIGRGRAVAPSMLYRTEFVRFNDWDERIRVKAELGFLMRFPMPDGIESHGIIALGGEGRTATYFPVQDPGSHTENVISGTEIKNRLVRSRRFKLYLSTPAVFKNGWYPDFLHADGNRLTGHICGAGFELVAAAVGKPVTISGWNMRKRQPRPLYRAVPAGSVYHFEFKSEITADLANELINEFHVTSICGKGIEQNAGHASEFERFARAGLGTTFVGVAS